MKEPLKDSLVAHLKGAGAYDVRVADPGSGFEHALEKQHPRQLMPGCRSVVVFAIAKPPAANNTYVGPLLSGKVERWMAPVRPASVQPQAYATNDLSHFFCEHARFAGAMFLRDRGYAVCFDGQCKLCAYEAGIGRYGRSGLILHPELGNRMVLGVILTDAEMPPDPRREDHDPCRDCDLCIRACPAEAYDPDKTYPESWSGAACMAKRRQVAAKGGYCHRCFSVCPAGKYADKDLLFLERVDGV